MEMMNPNMTAIIVMAFVYMGLGWVWYSPSLFGSMSCCTSKNECKSSCSWTSYIAEFALACIMGYVLSNFVMAMHADSVMSGAKVGFWAWFGFMATAGFSKVLWGHKSITKFLVCSGFYLIMLMIMGATFAVWH